MNFKNCSQNFKIFKNLKIVHDFQKNEFSDNIVNFKNKKVKKKHKRKGETKKKPEE